MSQRILSTPSPLINIAARAVFKAARGLLRDFGEVENLQVSRKGPGDFVSVADQRSERTLYTMLQESFPDYDFLMEESGLVPSGRAHAPMWIIDPLDGTKNFLHGIPHFAISLALKEHDAIVAGIIYDPVKDELFWAQRGMGAFLNERRIRVSSRRDPREALIGVGTPGTLDQSEEFHLTISSTRGLYTKVSGVRTLGSASLDLAYVASGRLDGFFEYSAMPWDIAAGVILVREAGGFVGDMQGEHRGLLTKGGIVVGNEFMFRFLLDSIAKPTKPQ